MARRAVQAEELGTAGNVGGLNLAVVVLTAQRLHGDAAVLVVHELGAATVRRDVRSEGECLGLGVARTLALSLRVVGHHRHTAGVDLEVHGAFTGTDQGRAAVLNALQVGAVAGDTRDVVDVLAFLDHRLLVSLGVSNLSVRGQCGCQEAGAGEAERERGCTSDRAPGLATNALLLWCVFHLVSF